ncbi:MAG: PAS domain S-box protein [Methanomassiliicoccales archaeon]|nr:PAS domain S-box protein [Methanomassiliicoccales archaeon]
MTQAGSRKADRTNRIDDSKLSLFRSTLENSEDAIIGCSIDGTIILWNRGAERIYGYSEKEALGQSISIIIPSGGLDEMPSIMERIGKGQPVHHYEVARRLKDGRLITVSVSISAIRDEQGAIVGASMFARDITEEVAIRRRNEERLETASQYSRSLIEASLDPLVTISPEGKITDVNQATVDVTGTGRDELIGTDFSDYFTEPEKARVGYQRVFAEGFVTDYPLTIRHRAGRLTDVLYNASLYRDSRGNVLGVFAAARDVTARKKAEEELALQRKRELDRLSDLEKFQRLTVGRELKMVELKKEIEDLRKENEILKQNDRRS